MPGLSLPSSRTSTEVRHGNLSEAEELVLLMGSLRCRVPKGDMCTEKLESCEKDTERPGTTRNTVLEATQGSG